MKIGEEKYDIAKKMAIFSLIWSTLIGITWGLILNLFVSNIANIFTKEESSRAVLEKFLIVWSWVMPFDMLWPCICTLFKLVDKVFLNSILTVATWCIIPPLFTYYGLFLSDIGGMVTIYCWIPTLLLSDGIGFFLIFFTTDWHKIPKLLINKNDKLGNADQNDIELHLLEN